MAILGNADCIFYDSQDQVNMQTTIETNKNRLQFLGDNGYNPSYTSSDPLIFTPFVYKLGTGAINIGTNNDVKDIRWFYRLGVGQSWTEVTVDTSNFVLVKTGNKKTSLKLIQNIMNESAPSLSIKCEVDYKESWMPEVFTSKDEEEVILSVQGNNGEDAYTVILTNESQTIASNSEGVPSNGEIGSSGKAKTTVEVYRGATKLNPSSNATPSSGYYYATVKTKPTGTNFVKESDNKTFYLDNASGSSLIPDSGVINLEVRLEGGSTKVEKLFSFTKAKAGYVGADAYSAVLTNDGDTVGTDDQGNGGNYQRCVTQIKLYKGASELTSANGVTYQYVASEGVVGNGDNNGSYQVTNLTTDNGSVMLKALYDGNTFEKQYTIAKTKGGASGNDASSYWLVTSANVITKDKNGVYNPKTIKIEGKTQTGTQAPKEYAGRFKIEETTDGTAFTQKYISTTNQSTHTYTPSSGIKAIRVTMYLAGGTSYKIDEEMVNVVTDGLDGESARTLEITGIQVFNVTASGSTTPSSIILTATTKNITGTIQWQRKNGSSWDNLSTGNTITITPSQTGWSNNQLVIKAYVTSDTAVFDEFTVYKVQDGKNSMVVDIGTPQGTIIKNHDRQSLDLVGYVYWGGIDKSEESTCKYKWEKQNANGTWTLLRDFTAGATGRNITIQANDIPNKLHVRCTMQYDSQTQSKSVSLQDLTDPYQIGITSTAGYNFTNGQIDTHVIATINQNGIELGTINMYGSLPATSQFKEGDIIYLTSDDKYYELKSNTWTKLTETPTIENGKSQYNYTWYKLGASEIAKNGKVNRSTTYFNNGKIVRITNRDVNQVANFRVVVEDKY